MKFSTLCSLLLCAALPAAADTKPGPAKSDTLDSYFSALNDEVTLSKDEQTAIKARYQEDSAKIQAILNNTALSPIEQQRQIDELSKARETEVDRLLKDVDRQARFNEFEKSHRVELVELAARGGPAPAPNAPPPAVTPPAQAEKTTPGV